MKFTKEDKEILEFSNNLDDSIKHLLIENKTLPHILVGILQHKIYNIHRTMEEKPELSKEIVNKYFPKNK